MAKKKVMTYKFSSAGQIMSHEKEEIKSSAKKEKEGSESEDDEDLKNEQLQQVDYGYKEKAIVLPKDDCFYKL